MSTFAERLAEFYRNESGRCLATLVRLTGDLDAAEDALADAFAIASDRWSRDGFPPNPGGWIVTTARNRAIDHHRREAGRDERHAAAARLDGSDAPQPLDLGPVEVVPDDQLRLIFLSCHPDLPTDAQVALTLRLVCGLTTPEIARAFLVAEATMAQRLVRAKRHIRDRKLAYRIPPAPELAARTDAVLATIYLLFNEGHTAAAGDTLGRVDLAVEAIRVARLLRELLPDVPEVAGLLALLLLTEARRPARVDERGDPVRLPDQDRTLWDPVLIAEGLTLVREYLAIGHPGPYQLQASIAAVHADAARADATDWAQIVELYDHLLTFVANPIVELNRAIAVAEVDGPAAGLALIEPLRLGELHLFHATRAEFLAALGRDEEAAAAFGAAVARARNEAERRHLVRRRREVGR